MKSKPTLIARTTSKPQQVQLQPENPHILLARVLAEKEAAGTLVKPPVDVVFFRRADFCSAQQYVTARQPGLPAQQRDAKARALMAS